MHVMQLPVRVFLAAVLVHAACSIVHADLARAAKASRASPATRPVEAVKRAEALYNDGHYFEAAQAFDQLSAGSLKYLYYAGLAYEALGHDGQAILRWQAVLRADGVEESVRVKSGARLAEAKRRTTRMHVVVSPVQAAVPKVGFSRQRNGDRTAFEIPLTDLESGVYLEPGPWEISVRSLRSEYGDSTIRKVVDVGVSEASVDIELPPVERAVTLRLAPSNAASAAAKVTFTDTEGLEPERSVVLRGEAYPLKLRLGRWAYDIESPDVRPAHGEFTVTQDGPVTLAVTFEPRGRKPSRELRSLAIGAGVTSLVLAGAGGVGLEMSFRSLPKLESADGRTYYSVTHSNAAIRTLDGLDVSRTALGMSVGFLATSLTAAGRRPKARKWAWIAEEVAGAIAVGVGGGILGVAQDGLRPALRDARATGELNGSSVEFYTRGATPGTLLLGLGASLLVGSTTGLIVERYRGGRGDTNAQTWRVRSLAPLVLSF